MSKNLHNYILRDENAVYYECGFSCDNEIFLQLGSEAFFITDPRYTLEAKECVKNAEVIEAERDLYEKVVEILKKAAISELHFDPNDWSVAAFEKLSATLEMTFIPSPNFSQKKRIIKSSQEIEIIKKAAKLGASAFNAFAKHINAFGLDKTEKYLFFDAIEKFQKHGEFALSFEPIVALNENAAKPHALPSTKILQLGDHLLVDAGLKFQRYCSDRTRCAEIDGNISFEISDAILKTITRNGEDIIESDIMHAVTIQEDAKIEHKPYIPYFEFDLDRNSYSINVVARQGTYKETWQAIMLASQLLSLV